MPLQTSLEVIEAQDGLRVRTGQIDTTEIATTTFALGCLSVADVPKPDGQGRLEIMVAPGVSPEEVRQYLGMIGCVQ